jgi:hypothetical protein
MVISNGTEKALDKIHPTSMIKKKKKSIRQIKE